MLQRDYFQIADESAESALEGMLADDQNAISREVLEAQISLGIREPFISISFLPHFASNLHFWIVMGLCRFPTNRKTWL